METSETATYSHVRTTKSGAGS